MKSYFLKVRGISIFQPCWLAVRNKASCAGVRLPQAGP